MPEFDLFISYRRSDADQVLPLVAALRQRGLSVWLDQHAIGEFSSITAEIRQGLSQSKALLAWYSEAYPKSRPCQMELTAALLAAQRDGDPRRRVLVVNPGPGAAHIEPIELRDAQYAVAPSDAAEYAALAEWITAHVATLASPLGAILPIVPPIHYGLTLTGANRFVGRLPDLWRIHSALHASENPFVGGRTAPGLALVTGLGGVGKSLLAEEYALRFGAAYPGGIFWLRAPGNTRAPHANPAGAEAGRIHEFFRIAVALGIDARGLPPTELDAELRARLAQNRPPFLWIIDDLPSGLEADALRAWLAPAALGKTLVTTRSREYSAIGTPVPLGMLLPHEALDLLCSGRSPDGAAEQVAARGIAHDLGYHALALDVSAAALAAQSGIVSFSEFRTNLAHPLQDELELAAELAGMLPSGHEKSVAATMLRSVAGLQEEGQDFLRLAALVAVAPISPPLVVATFLTTDGLTESEAKRRAVRAQHQVERASLAERVEGEARLVHTLVSRTMRWQDQKPARRTALRAALVDVLNDVLSKEMARPGAVPGPETEHARALLGSTEPWDARVAQLAVSLARQDYQRGLYAVALSLQEHALQVQQHELGDAHLDTLTSMNDLALMRRAGGDLAGACALQERVVAACLRVLGEEHPDTLMSMSNYAAMLQACDDLSGARKLQEHVLQVQRRTLGVAHPDTFPTMHNLAVTLHRQGDLPSARGLLDRVLELRRRMLGNEHPDTLATLQYLVALQQAQGDWAAVRTLQERVIEARRRALGNDHPDTLASVDKLAQILQAQGDLAGARRLVESVLEARVRVLGEQHPHVLASMHTLALIMQAQGDLGRVRELQERVFDVTRRVLGEEHSDTLASINSLAWTLRSQGDLSGARRLQERVLEVQRRFLGEQHAETLTTMNNLAETLRAQGDLRAASALHETVLTVLRELLGDEHPHTLSSMNNLALILQAQGDLSHARQLQERVLDAHRRLLGAKHPDTLRSMHNLAETLRSQGDLPAARRLHERALEERQRLLGAQHEDVSLSAWHLFLTLRKSDDEPAALRVLTDALAWLDDAHPAELTANQRAIKQQVHKLLRQSQ